MQKKVNQMSQNYYKAVQEQQIEGGVVNQRFADEVFRKSMESRYNPDN